MIHTFTVKEWDNGYGVDFAINGKLMYSTKYDELRYCVKCTWRLTPLEANFESGDYCNDCRDKWLEK